MCLAIKHGPDVRHRMLFLQRAFSPKVFRFAVGHGTAFAPDVATKAYNKRVPLNRQLFADQGLVRVCHMLLPLVQKVLRLKGAFTGTLDSTDGKTTGFPAKKLT